MKKGFPLTLNIEGRLAVVVGGGAVARRKALALLESGARVKAIAPELDERLRERALAGAVEWVRRGYEDGDLAGAFICVAATDDRELNARVLAGARAAGALANVADDPDSSDYQVPSSFRDGPLLVSLSTSGKSPALSRGLRRLLQNWLGGNFGAALEVLNSFRETEVRERIADAKDRVRFWESALDRDLIERIRTGRAENLEAELEKRLGEYLGGEK